MILGLDNAVGGAALAGDITGKIMAISLNSYSSRGISMLRSSRSGGTGRTGRRVRPCRFPS